MKKSENHHKSLKVKPKLLKSLYTYSFFLLLIAIVSLLKSNLDTYALWYETNNQPSDNLISTGCFEISFNDLDDDGKSSSINLLNSYPITDTVGVRLKPYTFTLKNICNIKGNYHIVLSKLSNSDIDTNYLRYTFNKIDNPIIVNPIPQISTTALDKNTEAIINERNKPNSIVDNYTLEEGFINPNEEITYEFRLWLNEEADNSQMQKNFEGVISISSIASN